MNRIMLKTAAAVLSSLAILIAADAHASIAITTFSPNDTATSGNFSMGWEFSLNTDVTVNQLGFWDDGTGLAVSHDVGIWTAAGAPLVFGTVGSTGPSTPGFVYVTVPSTVLLASGGNYVIGAYVAGDNVGSVVPPNPGAGSITFNAAVNYVTDRADTSPVLIYPAFSAPPGMVNAAWFGPTFGFADPAPPGGSVPEPVSLAAWSGMGLLGLVMARRRKKA